MMTLAWAQRQEELLRDCIVSPDVCDSMVDRLGDFVVPYQYALGTAASQRNVHLSLVGLRSPLDCKNAGKIAAFVDVERLVSQAFIGTAPWDHRQGDRTTLPILSPLETSYARLLPPGALGRGA